MRLLIGMPRPPHRPQVTSPEALAAKKLKQAAAAAGKPPAATGPTAFSPVGAPSASLTVPGAPSAARVPKPPSKSQLLRAAMTPAALADKKLRLAAAAALAAAEAEALAAAAAAAAVTRAAAVVAAAEAAVLAGVAAAAASDAAADAAGLAPDCSRVGAPGSRPDPSLTSVNNPIVAVWGFAYSTKRIELSEKVSGF